MVPKQLAGGKLSIWNQTEVIEIVASLGNTYTTFQAEVQVIEVLNINKRYKKHLPHPHSLELQSLIIISNQRSIEIKSNFV